MVLLMMTAGKGKGYREGRHPSVCIPLRASLCVHTSVRPLSPHLAAP